MDRIIILPKHIGEGVIMTPHNNICKYLVKFSPSTRKRNQYSKSGWTYYRIQDHFGETYRLSDSRIQNLLTLRFGKGIEEYVYRDYLADTIPYSRTEVTIESGRVDILTPDKVIEVKVAKNWKHALGQTLVYSTELQKKACVALIGKLSPICKRILSQLQVDNINFPML